MLTLLCPRKLCRIPDSNTGARFTTSWPILALHKYYGSVRDQIDGKFRQRMATRGSWPNLRFYFCQSQLIESLWARPNPVARDVFTGILGKNPFPKSAREHSGENLVFFFNLLTLKLWLDQRAGISSGGSGAHL